jgi:hypothetical protein
MGDADPAEKTVRQAQDEEVFVVVGAAHRLPLLTRLRPATRLVVFSELSRALDYLSRHAAARVLIDPAAFGA